jgi:hypothetical protein
MLETLKRVLRNSKGLWRKKTGEGEVNFRFYLRVKPLTLAWGLGQKLQMLEFVPEARQWCRSLFSHRNGRNT